MTSQEPENTRIADHDIPDTEVIVVPPPAPVFVDSTGRRRKVLRRLAYVFGGLCMLYGGLISVSLAGGPVSSNVVLPLPDLDGDENADVADAKPAPTATPPVTAGPRTPFLTEALRRRTVPSTPDNRAEAARRSTATPDRTPTPQPTANTPTPRASGKGRLVESGTARPGPSRSPSPSPSASSSSAPAPEPPAAVPPVPPAPPQPGGTGGGTGSGASAGSDSLGVTTTSNGAGGDRTSNNATSNNATSSNGATSGGGPGTGATGRGGVSSGESLTALPTPPALPAEPAGDPADQPAVSASGAAA